MKGRFIFFSGVFLFVSQIKPRVFYELVNALKLSYTPVFLPSLLPSLFFFVKVWRQASPTAQVGLDSVVLLFHPPE